MGCCPTIFKELGACNELVDCPALLRARDHHVGVPRSVVAHEPPTSRCELMVEEVLHAEF